MSLMGTSMEPVGVVVGVSLWRRAASHWCAQGSQSLPARDDRIQRYGQRQPHELCPHRARRRCRALRVVSPKESDFRDVSKLCGTGTSVTSSVSVIPYVRRLLLATARLHYRGATQVAPFDVRVKGVCVAKIDPLKAQMFVLQPVSRPDVVHLEVRVYAVALLRSVASRRRFACCSRGSCGSCVCSTDTWIWQRRPRCHCDAPYKAPSKP